MGMRTTSAPITLLAFALVAAAVLPVRRASAQTFVPATKLTTADGTPRLVGAVGGRALYSLEVSGAPATLWATDGTTSQSIFSGIGTGRIGIEEALGVVDGKLVFSYRDGLYATGGTSATTVRLANVGVRRDLYGGFSVVEPSRAYFNRGGDVWTTDGTAAGTTLVRKLAWPSTRWAPLTFAKASTSVLFSLSAGAETADNGLWTVSPLAATNILPGRFNDLDRACGGLAFLRSAAAPVGAGLARTDGTTAGTVHLAAALGEGKGVCLGSKYVVAAGDQLYASDGTSAGTTVLRASSAGERVGVDLVQSGSLVFFTQEILQPSPGVALFRTDGTAAGTFELYRLEATAPGDQIFVDLAGAVGTSSVLVRIERSAAPAAAKTGFVVSNGTVAGTRETVIGGFSVASRPVAYAGKLYFWAKDSASGAEPWMSDGTTAGTKRLEDVRPGANGSQPSPIVSYESTFFGVDGRLFTSADDGIHGRQIMVARVGPSNGPPPADAGADKGPTDPTGPSEPTGPDQPGSTDGEPAATAASSGESGGCRTSPSSIDGSGLLLGLGVAIAAARRRRKP